MTDTTTIITTTQLPNETWAQWYARIWNKIAARGEVATDALLGTGKGGEETVSENYQRRMAAQRYVEALQYERDLQELAAAKAAKPVTVTEAEVAEIEHAIKTS